MSNQITKALENSKTAAENELTFNSRGDRVDAYLGQYNLGFAEQKNGKIEFIGTLFGYVTNEAVTVMRLLENEFPASELDFFA